jgi:hypothetical protein
MIRGIFAALVFSWLPLLAFAQQPAVRSGEHEGFSRLVVPLPDGKDWEVVHAGQVVTFTVSDYAQGYDLSNIFKFISRDRVQTVTPQPDGFVINMGCDCRVAPFIDQKRYVVLDITSPGIKRSIAFAPVMPIPTPTIPVPAALTKVKETAVTLPLVPAKRPSMIEPAELPVLARAPLSDIENETLTKLQRRLTRELGTATTRGLLTPVPGPSLPAIRRAQVDLSEIVLPEVMLPLPRPETMGDVVNNMRVTSSMDIPGGAPKTSNPQSLSGLNCPLNSSLDVASWADNRPFHQQTGDLRRELYQEFDKLNRSATLKLAKLYLHYGFGAEARQIMHLDPELARTEEMLTDIAAILETGVAPPNSMLHSMLDCETDVALWAMLARQDLGVARSIDPRPALLSLNKLPVHLRSFLAPALSKRLLSHGDTDAAATALRSLERLPAKLPSSAKLAKAQIALDEGELKKGTNGLSDVIDDNAEQSPEALIALIETRVEAHQPVSPETASLIEAYAKELKQTELGPELMRAHALALAKSAQFDAAFKASKDLAGQSEEEAAKLRGQLLDELTAAADDVVFLEHIFAQSSQDIARLSARQKLPLATRMFELGFAEQAQSIISDLPDRPRNEARQLLAARIALDLSQPMRAQAELLEMTGEEVDLMRAIAKQMAGAHAEASDLYRSANNEDAAIRAAWLADAGTSPDLSGNAVFGPVLALSDAEIPALNQTNGMLARSEAALNESSAARQALLDLLQAPELNIGITGETR